MPTERFDFPGTGGHVLSGRLDLPDGLPRAHALLVHCFTCGKDGDAAVRIAAALAAQGIATLRFDFTGLGDSEGEFANTDFSSNIADLVAAADHLRALGRAPALLVGHGLGGAAVLAAARHMPEARAVAVIGAPFEAAQVVARFRKSVPEIDARGEARVCLAGRSFTIHRGFLDDVRAQDQAARIAQLGRALLVLHSPLDEVVGIDNARRVFDAARHPKSFVSLDDADHLLSQARDAEYAASVLSAWAARYVNEAVAQEPAPPVASMPDAGAVVVVETGRGRFQQGVSVGLHRFLADEPVAFGGLGTGPGPYDLLAAALGACTAMTLRLYADAKGLPLGPVRVTLRHRKIHASDCADCETQEGKLDEILREIELPGPLDAEQRVRLLAISDRCPIHRSLHGEVKVRTTEVPLTIAHVDEA